MTGDPRAAIGDLEADGGAERPDADGDGGGTGSRSVLESVVDEVRKHLAELSPSAATEGTSSGASTRIAAPPAPTAAVSATAEAAATGSTSLVVIDTLPASIRLVSRMSSTSAVSRSDSSATMSSSLRRSPTAAGGAAGSTPRVEADDRRRRAVPEADEAVAVDQDHDVVHEVERDRGVRTGLGDRPGVALRREQARLLDRDAGLRRDPGGDALVLFRERPRLRVAEEHPADDAGRPARRRCGRSRPPRRSTGRRRSAAAAGTARRSSAARPRSRRA